MDQSLSFSIFTYPKKFNQQSKKDLAFEKEVNKSYPEEIKRRKEHGACHVMGSINHVNNLQFNNKGRLFKTRLKYEKSQTYMT